MDHYYLTYIERDDLSGTVPSNMRLFADDSVIFKEVKNEKDKNILQDVDTVNTWVKINKMGMNVGKC